MDPGRLRTACHESTRPKGRQAALVVIGLPCDYAVRERGGFVRPLPILSFFVLFSSLYGCSRAGVTTARLPDGTREIRCEHALWKCLLHVDDYCRGASYEVLRASDEQLVYGSQTSAVEGRRSYALIRCMKPGVSPPPPEDLAAATPEPPAAAPAAAPAAPSPLPAPPPPASAKVERCVPGATQTCVGPAACNGGQACLPDGSGFGPCDCGTSSPTAPP
jgi:hypothetical protein